MGYMVRKIILVCAAALLAGCVTQEQMQKVVETQKPPTAEDKAAAIKYVRETFFDPYSIRDASISGSVTSPNAPGLKAICVRFNAKNRMGGYVGLTATSLRIAAGKVESSVQSAPGCLQEQLKYYPFTELEHL